jgi:hypothetical protein
LTDEALENMKNVSLWDFAVETIAATDTGNVIHAIRLCSDVLQLSDIDFSDTAFFLLLRIAVQREEMRVQATAKLLAELTLRFGMRKLIDIASRGGTSESRRSAANETTEKLSQSENPGRLLASVSFWHWNTHSEFYFDLSALYSLAEQSSAIRDNRPFPKVLVRVPILDVRLNIGSKVGLRLFDEWTDALMRSRARQSILV